MMFAYDGVTLNCMAYACMLADFFVNLYAEKVLVLVGVFHSNVYN